MIAAGSQVSIDGKGHCIDNIPIERFWRTIKYEHVFLDVYDNVRQARKKIGEFIHFYNERRVHQNLGYATPQEVFQGKRTTPSFIFGRKKKAEEKEKINLLLSKNDEKQKQIFNAQQEKFLELIFS